MFPYNIIPLSSDEMMWNSVKCKCTELGPPVTYYRTLKMASSFYGNSVKIVQLHHKMFAFHLYSCLGGSPHITNINMRKKFLTQISAVHRFLLLSGNRFIATRC